MRTSSSSRQSPINRVSGSNSAREVTQRTTTTTMTMGGAKVVNSARSILSSSPGTTRSNSLRMQVNSVTRSGGASEGCGTGVNKDPASARRSSSLVRRGRYDYVASRYMSAPRPSRASSEGPPLLAGVVSTPYSSRNSATRYRSYFPSVLVSERRFQNSYQGRLMDDRVKLYQEREYRGMRGKIDRLMALPRPDNAQYGYRINERFPIDIRTMHLERKCRDPMISEHFIKCTRNPNRDHMHGVLGNFEFIPPMRQDFERRHGKMIMFDRNASHLRPDGSTDFAPRSSSRQLYPHMYSNTIPWEREAVSGRVCSKARYSHYPQAASCNPLLPGTHNTASAHRSRYPSGSMTHKHHDVFKHEWEPYSQAPPGAPRPLPCGPERLTCMKRREQILAEMAAEPPLELPPRKKPGKRPVDTYYSDNDIFLTGKESDGSRSERRGRMYAYGPTNGVCNALSDPNDMVTREPFYEPVPGKKFVATDLKFSNDPIGGAGPLVRPETTNGRRRTPNEHITDHGNLTVPEWTSQERRTPMTVSPMRRINLSRGASDQMLHSLNHVINEPFNFAMNESARHGNRYRVAPDMKLTHPSPMRYPSPGFHSKAAVTMRDIFNWD